MPKANTTGLPFDENANPIQILSPVLQSTVHLAATEGADDSAAMTAGSEIVRVACNGAVYLAFGGSAVDAGAGENDSFIFTAGVEVFHLRDATYTWVAARSLSGEGNQPVTITTME